MVANGLAPRLARLDCELIGSEPLTTATPQPMCEPAVISVLPHQRNQALSYEDSKCHPATEGCISKHGLAAALFKELWEVCSFS